MFVHKSMLTAGFACAAVMVISLAAGPAGANGLNAQQNDYCSAPEVCSRRQIGIIQKERDGVNYFYGGSDVPAPQVNYVFWREDTIDDAINISNVNTTDFAEPQYTHRFRMKKDHWKKKGHWKWSKNHPDPFKLQGLNAGGKYIGP